MVVARRCSCPCHCHSLASLFSLPQTVYQSERVGAAGKTYHAECFRCAHCHVILATATFCNNQVSNYCPSCYQMLVNKHGANF